MVKTLRYSSPHHFHEEKMKREKSKIIPELIGQKILAIRGFRDDRRRKYHKPEFILLSDRITVIQLLEQDYYDYHDCDYNARNLRIIQDRYLWFVIWDNKCKYPDANQSC